MHTLSRYGLTRQIMIREQDDEVVSLPRHPGIYRRMGAFDWQSFLAQAMQQLEGAIHWLGNAVQSQQTESAVEGQRWKIRLLKNIRKGPKGVCLHEITDFQGGLGGEGGGIRLVLARIAQVRGSVPLGVEKR